MLEIDFYINAIQDVMVGTQLGIAKEMDIGLLVYKIKAIISKQRLERVYLFPIYI